MKNYKQNIIKIYQKSDLPLKLELTPETVSELIIKIRRLDAYRISGGVTDSIFDLNPEYGKTLAHLVTANDFFKKITFIYQEKTFDIVTNLLKKIKLRSSQMWSGNNKDFFKIKEFASVNISIDSFVKGNEKIEHVWNHLKPNQLLITAKNIPNTYPITVIEASFLGLKTKTKLNIYRKTWVKHGIPSRFGVL